jgi:RimJ/RimL family protein N-acetyltransferase
MINGQRKQEYLDFFNQILGSNRTLDSVKMIAEVDADDNPIAVVLFSNFNGFNMELAIASKAGWVASKRFFRECFHYAFNTCGALRVTSVVDERNTKALEFNRRIGIEREFDGVLKNWFGVANGILLVMHKDKCKWIKQS